jgi:pentatricopeptide repeat protein
VPPVYTYSACINAFAKSSDLEAPNHAENLLSRMKECVLAGDRSLNPNVVNYNACINAWGRSRFPHAAEKAEDILRMMQADGIKPDALSYSLVVSAWCHSSAPGGILRADSILKEMEISMIGGVKSSSTGETLDSSMPMKMGKAVLGPANIVTGDQLDVECYNSLLIALSKSLDDDAIDRSLALLSRMKKMASLGFQNLKPNTKSWNAVLNTISRSSKPDAALVAEEVFTRMQKVTKPDVFSFAALLHVYQKSSADRGAAHRADAIVRTMEEMFVNGEISSPPDVYHYTIVCSCWARSVCI